MKFHSIHGRNIQLIDGDTRAVRTVSFCDAITFGNKPLSINSRISVQLNASEEWSGALRLGVTSHDPSSLTPSMLPRFACPDVFFKDGFWARPIPEEWAKDGTKLTFYVNSQGYFHVFVNNEHKGALLSGLSANEQLWPILDLYGITVSIKFIATESNPPEEVVARGPEALRAYEHSCCEGSISLFRTRIFLIGPPGGNTTLLKWKLVGERLPEVEEDFLGINTHFSCQTVEEKGKTWNIVSSTTEEDIQDVKECLLSTMGENDRFEDEYYRAIAVNVVKELLLQRKKKPEAKKRTPFAKSAQRLQSSLLKKGTIGRRSNKIENTENVNINKKTKRDPWSEDTLEEIPEKVVDLVESLLKEADLKEDWDKKEIEALSNPRINISFNIWEFSEEMFHLLPHQIFATSQAIYIYVLDLNRAVDEPITALTGFSETRPLANLTFTPLSLLHAWLTALHLTVAQNNKINSNTDGGDLPEEEDGVPALRPPVVIVGMLRKTDNVNEERQHITAEEMFVKIRESLRDSPYKHHVVPTCFMLDWRDTEKLEEHMEKLRETVRTLAVNQPQMPVEVPLRWLAFQREISNLLKKGVYMANYCQLYEVAQRQGISKEDEFWAMLNFLHDQGKLSSFPCNLVDKTRNKWEGIAVLSPQWFVNHIYKVFNPSLISNKTEQPKEDQSGGTSVTNGYLSDEYFNSVWSDVAACKQTFIGILENLDLLCELRKEKDPDGVDKKLANTYWIPWIARKQRSHTTTLRDESCCLRLYIDFHNLLPVGFFSRLVARLGGWSCRQEWTRLPQLSADQCRIAVHPGHDLLIEKALFAHAQIVVTVTRVFKPDHSDWSGKPPSVQVCEKVS